MWHITSDGFACRFREVLKNITNGRFLHLFTYNRNDIKPIKLLYFYEIYVSFFYENRNKHISKYILIYVFIS